MYLEHCINNNPKQQEEDYTSYRELRSKWENSQRNSRTKCLASWGLKSKQTRWGGRVGTNLPYAPHTSLERHKGPPHQDWQGPDI